MYPKDLIFYTNSDFSKLCFRNKMYYGANIYKVIKNPFTIKQYRELNDNTSTPRQFLLQALVEQEIRCFKYHGLYNVVIVFKNGVEFDFPAEGILGKDFLEREYGLAPHLVLSSDIGNDANTTADTTANTTADTTANPTTKPIEQHCDDISSIISQNISTPQFDIPYDIIIALRIECLADAPKLRDKMSKLMRHYQLSDEALIERLLLNDSSPENNQMIDNLFELRYFNPIHSRRDFSIELFEKYQKGYLLKLLTKHLASERNRKTVFKKFTLTHDFVNVVREIKPEKRIICELLDEIAGGKSPDKANVFHVLMKEMI